MADGYRGYCPFCDTQLQVSASDVVCPNGHYRTARKFFEYAWAQWERIKDTTALLSQLHRINHAEPPVPDAEQRRLHP